jgi:hypothetical protein
MRRAYWKLGWATVLMPNAVGVAFGLEAAATRVAGLAYGVAGIPILSPNSGLTGLRPVRVSYPQGRRSRIVDTPGG